MALKWNNQREFDRMFELEAAEYNRKAVTFLAKIGEECVKHARENGKYTDRTANLRNSIGYIVIQHGQTVIDSFSGAFAAKLDPQGKADAEMAHQRGLAYANEVGATLGSKATFLVVVAGMEYAKYVEAKGYNVLNATESQLEKDREKKIREFKRYLKSKEK